MKKTIALLLCAVLTLCLFPSGAMASEIVESGTRDNVKWTLTADGTLTVSGTGRMPRFPTDGDFTKKNVKTLIIEDGITSVGEWFCYNCVNLTRVRLPESVTVISEYAFSYTPIRSIRLPKLLDAIGTGAFNHCTKLVDINLPKGLRNIGSGAFNYCVSLLYLTIPASVSQIGETAFNNCPNLTVDYAKYDMPDFNRDSRGVVFDSGMATLIYAPNNLSGDYTIPDGVTAIGDNAFKGCTVLKSVTISNSVKSIGENAFQSCSSLETVKMPDTVKVLGRFAFSKCESLKSVSIPQGLSTVPEGLFMSCTSIESISIPDDIRWIEKRAFEDCAALKSVYIPDHVIEIGEEAFAYCRELESVTLPDGLITLDGGAFGHCDALTHVDIPDSVEKIGRSAFGFCAALDEIRISANVTTIGDVAFRGCTNLSGIWIDEDNPNYCSDEKGVMFNKDRSELIQAPGGITGEYVIPDTVKDFNSYTFYGCDGLEGIVIPNGITTIWSSSFVHCTSLKKIELPDTVTNIGWSAFSQCTALEEINIPDGVETIESFTFSKCESLKSIDLPENLTVIELCAFSDCTSLERIEIPAGVKELSETFRRCEALKEVKLNEGLEKVDSVFSNCSSLTNIGLPSSLQKITYDAFDGCSSLEAITVDEANEIFSSDENGVLYNKNKTTLIKVPEAKRGTFVVPDGVAALSSSSFFGCKNLTEIILPEDLTNLGLSIFNGCSSLESIHIPNSVKSVNSYGGLYLTSSIKGIYVDENNEYFSNDEYGALYNKNKTTLIKAPTTLSGEYTVPDSVTEITNFAFAFCESLESIILPDSLAESITSDNSAVLFRHCKSLKHVRLPQGITAIPRNTFAGCEALEEIAIPDTVRTIGGSAFSGCKSLKNITLPTGLTTISAGAFNECTSLESIIIPAGVRILGEYAFYGCTSLKSIKFLGDCVIGEPTINSADMIIDEYPVFGGVTANVYYPAHFELYTQYRWLNYSGELTFNPFSVDVTSSAVEIEPGELTWIPYSHDTGDINGDGEIDNADLIILARWIVNMYDKWYNVEYTEVTAYADLNGDGTVDNSDLITMARRLVEK